MAGRRSGGTSFALPALSVCLGFFKNGANGKTVKINYLLQLFTSLRYAVNASARGAMKKIGLPVNINSNCTQKKKVGK